MSVAADRLLVQQPARRLAEFTASLRLQDVPEVVRERARIHILDALGVALAANCHPFAERAVAAATTLGGSGPCTVIGRSEHLPLRDAALANGILIHGLDFDDTHLTSIVHPTAACLPCCLSLAEALDAHGRSLLVGYAAAMETAIRIGAAVAGGFHHVGFHATAIVAHFSSAIGASKLLDLNADQMVSAQGLAASTAAGVQVFLEEGAWSKRFHAGWAAVAGITAARMAESGFVGPSRPYEGKFGLFETHLQANAKEIDVDRICVGLGDHWDLVDTAIKPYPVCHFIHGCADAAIDLHHEVGDSDQIVNVRVFLPRDTMPIVAEPAIEKQSPKTEYGAKFSAQFVVATCLLRGRFGLAELQESALHDERILRLAGRVGCEVDPKSAFPKYFSGGVEVTLRNGRKLERHVTVNSGAGDRALNREGVSSKFLAAAALRVSEHQAEQIRQAVFALEDLPAREIMQLLALR